MFPQLFPIGHKSPPEQMESPISCLTCFGVFGVFLESWFPETRNPQPSSVRGGFGSRLCQLVADQPPPALLGFSGFQPKQSFVGWRCPLPVPPVTSSVVPEALGTWINRQKACLGFPGAAVMPAVMPERWLCAVRGFPETPLQSPSATAVAFP